MNANLKKRVLRAIDPILNDIKMVAGIFSAGLDKVLDVDDVIAEKFEQIAMSCKGIADDINRTKAS